MTIVVRRYPVRALTLVEPLYMRRDVLREAEELLTEYLRKPEIAEYGLGSGLEIEEKKDRLVVKGELPDYKKGDLKISLKGDKLTVSAEKKAEKESKEEGFYSYSSAYASYYRELPLPAHVDGKNSSFRISKGKLQIKLPKAKKASQRLITIKAQVPKKKPAKTAKTVSK